MINVIASTWLCLQFGAFSFCEQLTWDSLAGVSHLSEDLSQSFIIIFSPSNKQFISFIISFSFIVSYSSFYLQENLQSVQIENLLSQLSLPFLVLCALNWVTRNFAVIQLSFFVRTLPPLLASSASPIRAL